MDLPDRFDAFKFYGRLESQGNPEKKEVYLSIVFVKVKDKRYSYSPKVTLSARGDELEENATHSLNSKLKFIGNLVFEYAVQWDGKGGVTRIARIPLNKCSIEVNEDNSVHLAFGVPTLLPDGLGQDGGVNKGIYFKLNSYKTINIGRNREYSKVLEGWRIYLELIGNDLPVSINAKKVGGFLFCDRRSIGKNKNIYGEVGKSIDRLNRWGKISKSISIVDIGEKVGLSISKYDREELKKNLTFDFKSREMNVGEIHERFPSAGFLRSDKLSEEEANNREKNITVEGYRVKQRLVLVAKPNSNVEVKEDTDIRIRKGEIHLRLRNAKNEWVNVGKGLFISANREGIIRNEDLWKDGFDYEAKFALSWKAKTLSAGQGNYLKNGAINSTGLWNSALYEMDKVADSLRHIKPANPESVIPKIEVVKRGENEYKLFALQRSKKYVGRINNNKINIAVDKVFQASLLSDEFLDESTDPKITERNKINLSAWWPNFTLLSEKEEQKTTLTLECDVSVFKPQHVSDDSIFSVKIFNSNHNLAHSILGGVYFDHQEKLLDEGENDYSCLKIGTATAYQNVRHTPIFIDMRLRFNIKRLLPVAQTSALAYELQPIMFKEDLDYTENKNSKKSQYILDIREGIGKLENRHFSAKIIEHDDRSGSNSYILLSSSPFSIRRVYSAPLGARGDSRSVNVAEFNGNSQTWKIKTDSGSYHYVLPPQVIGESMDKPRRLEIHDVEMPNNTTNIKPYPDNHIFGLKRYPVEFRLSPPTNIWVKPSDLPKNYVVPEWEYAGIFNKQDAFGLGAKLEGLQSEFVYGLAVAVKTKDEVGESQFARAAEMEVLVGQPVIFNASSDEPSYSERINQLMSSYFSRPDRLEIGVLDRVSGQVLQPAKFSDGAQFNLRNTALHRHPVDDNQEYAEIGELRFHSQGLSGGALWPIESKSVLELVAALPEASSGEIENIALTSLGGDANQTAKFADRVSIITETRGGYIQRQKVEVIGRIAVLWHRAKHVVVYDRTVNPSVQFAPLGKDAKTRTRRPVLRKVQEYIEILEPDRRYPDAAEAKEHHNGFLKGVRFNSKIISVDSSWSEDVQDGWMIPLWNRYAATVRPQVYSRPDIAFLSQAEGKDDKALCSQECLNPENLYFFTDTRKDESVTGNTNVWPPRKKIDYADLGPPGKKETNAATALSGEVIENASRIPPGYQRFSWKLAEPATKIAFNAGRGKKVMYAALDTITFSRDSGESKDPVSFRDLLGTRESFAEINKNDSLGTKNYKGAWVKGEKLSKKEAENEDKFLLKRSEELGVLVSLLEPAPPKPNKIEDIKNAFKGIEDWRDIFNEEEVNLKKVIDGIATRNKKYKTEIDKYKELKLGGSDLCEGIQKNLRSTFSARTQALRQEFSAREMSLIADVNNLNLDKYKKYFKDEAALKKYLNENIKNILDPIFSPASIEAGKFRRDIETARMLVRQVVVDLDTSLLTAKAQIHKSRQAVNKGKPWSRSRMERIEQQFDTVLQRLYKRESAFLEDARRALALEISESSQGLESAAALAMEALGIAEEQFSDSLNKSYFSFSAMVDRFDNSLSQVAEYLKEEKIGKIRKEIKSWGEENSDYKAFSQELVTLIEENAIKKVKGKLGELKSSLAKVNDLGGEVKGDLETEIKKICSGIKKVLNNILIIPQSIAKELTGASDEVKSSLLEITSKIGMEDKAGLTKNLAYIAQTGNVADGILDEMVEQCSEKLEKVRDELGKIAPSVLSIVEESADEIIAKVSELENILSPASLSKKITENLVAKLVGNNFIKNKCKPIFEKEFDDNLDGLKISIKLLISEVFIQLDSVFEQGQILTEGLEKEIGDKCKIFKSGFKELEEDFKEDFEEGAKQLYEKYIAPVSDKLDALFDQIGDDLNKLDSVLKEAEKYKKLFENISDIDKDVRKFGNDILKARKAVESYGDKAVESITNIGKGGISSAPNNILKAMAAVGSVPDMPNLEYQKERMAYYYGLSKEYVDTERVEAWFGKLGDDLKAMGISLPFDKIGDQLEPVDLSGIDIGKIFGNFGGLDLSKLLNGSKMPKGINDAVKITHDFDKKAFKAWVQIDVNVPLYKRNTLFSFGPFKMDTQRTNLVGYLRLEASKDTDKVEQDGFAYMHTDLDAVVGGQSMVTLQDVKIRHGKSSGLKIDFDAKKIKLNPTFQFIQNTLSEIFDADEIGGMEIVKNSGVPVGLRHTFNMPPLSLVFGTSGVQNILISNQFELIAFPDFVIANRFSLSRPDLPFIFTIFVIGGTGYISITAEYRPFEGKGELLVIVEAAVGGAASLAFAFAGCTGSVAITFSGVMNYRKHIGESGGGLSIALLVVIMGIIDVLRIATAHLTVTLRLNYKDNGDIDGLGSFRVKIRISRFFKISAGGEVKYVMKGGKTKTTSTRYQNVKVADKNLAKAKKLMDGQEI